MRRPTLLVAALVALLLAVPAAQATDAPALGLVAAVYVGTPVTVHCDPVDQMNGAWGYTYATTIPDELWMDDTLCAALTGPGAEDWRKALAVLVLTHESWHLRVWLHRLDEARVECAAIRRWHQTAGLLGLNDGEQARLWPWALLEHYYIGYVFKLYRHVKCEVPTWPPWRP